MVPQMVQNILDAVTNGMIAKQIGQCPRPVSAHDLGEPGVDRGAV